MRSGIELRADMHAQFCEAMRAQGLNSNNLVRKMLGLQPELTTQKSGGVRGFRPDKLMEVIKARGLSMGGLSVAAGLPHNAVWQMVEGGYAPRVGRLLAICEVLGIRAEEVCDGC